MSSSVAVLVGLLVAAYVGSVLLARGSQSGLGLASGSEYLLFGFVLGPVVLGVVQRSVVSEFDPLVASAAAWLGITAGQRLVIAKGHSVSSVRLGFGLFAAGIVFACVMGVLWWLAPLFTTDPVERLPLCLGGAAVLSGTSWRALETLVPAQTKLGPVGRWIADMARAGSILPVLGIAAAGVFTTQRINMASPWLGLALTAGLGVGVGLLAVALLGREFRRDQSWGLLLGTSALGVGLAIRLGLSPLAVMFFMGLTLSAISPHRRELYALIQPTDAAITVPLLLVAGVQLDVVHAGYSVYLVIAALVARNLAEVARSGLFYACIPALRATRLPAGFALHSTGALSIAAALSYAVLAPGALGALFLTFAVFGALLGEMVGPPILRRVLARAGELEVPAAAPEHIFPIAAVTAERMSEGQTS